MRRYFADEEPELEQYPNWRLVEAEHTPDACTRCGQSHPTRDCPHVQPWMMKNGDEP